MNTEISGIKKCDFRLLVLKILWKSVLNEVRLIQVCLRDQLISGKIFVIRLNKLTLKIFN